jgi:N-acetylglucosamine-6-phosphate deacetylase
VLTEVISGLNVYTSEGVLADASVIIKNGKIADILRVQPTLKGLAFPANYHLIPGLIDLHVHGINHCDVMDAKPEALATISQTLAKEGTTSFLATTMTASVQDIEKALLAVRNHIKIQHNLFGATLLGVHLEGPFISPKKMGAQCADHMLLPSIEQFHHWQQLAENAIRLVTLAPELQHSQAFITYLKQQGVIAAIGHSDASYDETMAAMHHGCDYVTHLFNAMRGMHQREPGVVTAALLENVWTELIVDGVHLHPAIVRLILKMKGMDKMILVTDAMRATCLQNGIYDLGGQQVTVKGNAATLANGTLAGSVLRMPQAIKNMLQFTGCELMDAVKMASENPAKALGIFDKKGSIAIGKDADLVVLDDHLNVVMTMCGGRNITPYFSGATLPIDY